MAPGDATSDRIDQAILQSACLAQLGLAASGCFLRSVDPVAGQLTAAVSTARSQPAAESSVARALTAYARGDWWQPDSDAHFGLQLAWLLDDLSRFAEHLEQAARHRILRVDSDPTTATALLVDMGNAGERTRSASIALVGRSTPIEHPSLALIDQLTRGWPSEWKLDP